MYVVADNYSSRPPFPDDERVTILYPEKPLHAKLKSIQFAIDAFVRQHNTILILDADNLLHPTALRNFNRLVKRGYTAIQGQRTAKNLDTPVAVAITYNTAWVDEEGLVHFREDIYGHDKQTARRIAGSTQP